MSGILQSKVPVAWVVSADNVSRRPISVARGGLIDLVSSIGGADRSLSSALSNDTSKGLLQPCLVVILVSRAHPHP